MRVRVLKRLFTDWAFLFFGTLAVVCYVVHPTVEMGRVNHYVFTWLVFTNAWRG